MLELEPFDEGHVVDVAGLLAARHRAARAAMPDLHPGLEDPATARKALHAMVKEKSTIGVVARRGGEAVGYLLASIMAPPQASYRFVIVPYTGSAVHSTLGEEAWRELYAAVAPRWLEAGCFTHYVSTPASDADALEAWTSLDFGRDNVRAFRDTSAVDGAGDANDVEIRRARPEDIDVVVLLADELRRYQASSPIWEPYLPETRAGLRKRHEKMLADPVNHYWLAYQQGRAAGLHVYTQPTQEEPDIPERSIVVEHAYTRADDRGHGVGTALLRHGASWAREAGYERCSVNWESPSILASRFWRRHGFRPLSYWFSRRVDERVAWAPGIHA